VKKVTLSTPRGKVELTEQARRVTAQAYETPQAGSRQHLHQMRHDPQQLVMASLGRPPTPQEQVSEHRWGHQGVPSEIDGLVRLLRRAGAIHHRQQERDRQQAQELLFSKLDENLAEKICPEWLRQRAGKEPRT